MNKTFLLFSLSLATMAANAQQTPAQQSVNTLRQLMRPHRSQNVSKLLHAQSASAKTTSSNERLASYAIYQFDGSGMNIADSSKYWYSNPRGSEFDFTDMYYDDFSDAPKVQSDSFVNYHTGGNGFDLGNGSISTYNAAGKLDTKLILVSNPPGTPLANNAQFFFDYDASGNIITKYILGWNGTSFDSASKVVYTYNAANKVLTYTLYQKVSGIWSPTGKSENTYDVSGNLTQSLYYSYSGPVPDTSGRTLFTYYANNKLQTQTEEDYDGAGSFVPSTLDSFGYNGTDFYTFDETRDWNADSSRWEKSNMEVRHLNAVNLPDTIYLYGVDSATNDYVVNFKTAWKYNANNNPVETIGIFDLMGNMIDILHYYYYYEARWDLGVADVGKNSSFTVYPNPANNELNIKSRQAISGNVVAQVVNNLGQVVMQTMLAGSDNMKLSLAALQPGNYHLSLTDARGNKVMTQP
ncbi:MAG: T9SS type A sorting domain-containing protein, partial [Flavipsychrobacter sp.]